MAVVITGNNTPTAGGVTYGDGTTYANTAAGSAGQLLQSNGSSAPTWVAAGASALTLLSTVTASNSATIDVETTFSSTYDAYLLVASGVTAQNNSDSIRAQMKLSGSYVTTSTYLFATSANSSQYGASVLTSTTLGGPQTDIYLSANTTGTGASYSLDLQLSIYNPSSTAFSKIISWDGVTINASRVGEVSGIASNSGTGALTGIRFYFPTGNIVAGKFRLYGISNS